VKAWAEDIISAAILCCIMNLVTMTIVFGLPYCNGYGTDYQLRYVYRNNGSGIAVEYITGTSNLFSNLRLSQSGPLD
jgi:hypothetical protein